MPRRESGSPGFLACRSPSGPFRIRFDGIQITGVDLQHPAVRQDSSRLTFPLRQNSARLLPPTLRRAVRLLDLYFSGGRDPFLDDACFSTAGLTPFTVNVILGTRRIPPGDVATYTEFSRMLGLAPSFRRAVGGALGRNPFPIFYPCHRVVGNQTPGGFSSGLAWKHRLLRHEGVTLG